MTAAWLATLAAQAILASALRGPLRWFMAWQSAAGLILLICWRAGAYHWPLVAYRIVDAAVLTWTLWRVFPPQLTTWRMAAAGCSISVSAVIAHASAQAHGAGITPEAILYALPHVPTALGLLLARGPMLAFLAIRWAMLIAGWAMWSLSREVWIGHQIAQMALVVWWAASMTGGVRASGYRPPERG